VETAKNDDWLRRVNDDRRVRFGQRERALALICECGEPGCRQTVLLTVDEYDALRPGLILHPGHTETA